MKTKNAMEIIPQKQESIKEIQRIYEGFEPNESKSNYNEYLGICLNKVTVSNSGYFSLYVNIFNFHKHTIEIIIKNVMFVTIDKEQIIGQYDKNNIDYNKAEDKILTGFNILRKIQFYNPRKLFDLNDSVVIEFELLADGVKINFMLTENFILVKNKEIVWE
ncbi:hypothetical protein [Halpernia sp. GG3]